MEARLDLERRDRRFAESALSSRDLFEIERSAILEMIARGDVLPSILSSLAGLVEHHRARSICLDRAASPGRPPGRLGAGPPDAVRGPDTGRSRSDPRRRRSRSRRRSEGPVATRDVPGDPLWESSRDLFAPHGIAACWTVPIEAGTGTVLRDPLRAASGAGGARASPTSRSWRTRRALAAIAIEQRQLSDQLAFQAHYDRLTNLPNRLYLEEAARAAVSRAARRGERVTLLFVDLDRFKRVNDTFGHAGGDALLAQVALRLAARRRRGRRRRADGRGRVLRSPRRELRGRGPRRAVPAPPRRPAPSVRAPRREGRRRRERGRERVSRRRPRRDGAPDSRGRRDVRGEGRRRERLPPLRAGADVPRRRSPPDRERAAPRDRRGGAASRVSAADGPRTGS